jgi:hypothetical protein
LTGIYWRLSDECDPFHDVAAGHENAAILFAVGDGGGRIVGLLRLASTPRGVHLSSLSVCPAHPSGVRADSMAFPEDGPEGMRQESQQAGYTFPYLFDETQSVAKLFKAACTPDLFLFDARGTLVYRGQFDDSRPRSAVPITGADIRAAATAVLLGNPVPVEQKPSIGCNIKWKRGNEPDYL